jgi:hypothetical protein
VRVRNQDPRVLLVRGIVHGEAEVFRWEADTREMKVVFRKLKRCGSVIAVFPEVMIDPDEGHIAFYRDATDVGGAVYGRLMRRSVPASEREYTPLFEKLVRAGYDNMKVMKRCRPVF